VRHAPIAAMTAPAAATAPPIAPIQAQARARSADGVAWLVGKYLLPTPVTMATLLGGTGSVGLTDYRAGRTGSAVTVREQRLCTVVVLGIEAADWGSFHARP
jgi:hypothetical protein